MDLRHLYVSARLMPDSQAAAIKTRSVARVRARVDS